MVVSTATIKKMRARVVGHAMKAGLHNFIVTGVNEE
jgi:hypothetical protein